MLENTPDILEHSITPINHIEVPRPRLYSAIGSIARNTLFRLRPLSINWEEELSPTEQPRIFASNHKSNIDPPALGLELLDSADIQAYTLGKQEIFFPPLSWLLTSVGGIKFNRARNLTNQPAGQVVSKLLDKKANLVLFLEGTRFRGEELGPMQKVGALAVRKNAIIYPTAIAGTNKKFGKIHIEVGKPYNDNALESELSRKETIRYIDESVPADIQRLYEIAVTKI